jgi:hypothetical protein
MLAEGEAAAMDLVRARQVGRQLVELVVLVIILPHWCPMDLMGRLTVVVEVEAQAGINQEIKEAQVVLA